MTISRRALLTAGGCAPLLSLTARAAPQGDIAILRRAYTLLHPGLYRYSSPARIDARFDALEQAFAAPQDLAARYLTLSRFLATIRCGHTYANFFNQPDATQKALFQSIPCLPVHFCWLGNRMIVTRDFSGAGILPGSEIVSLDGRTGAQILSALMPLVRADGGNDAKRRMLLSVQGTEKFESFDIYYVLTFKPSGKFQLVVSGPDDKGNGKRRSMTMAAIDPVARLAEQTHATEGPELWRFETRGQTGILTMPDWALYDSKWDWRAWLDDVLARAGSLTGLVIDLRANEGGLDCGDPILARLTDQPLPRDNSRRLVRYRRVPADLVPYLKTWDPSFRTLGKDAAPFDDLFFELADEPGVSAIQPTTPRLRLKLAVLIGAQNSSATFQFAQTIQQNRLGVLVGETTGGNKRGINGGSFFFLALPQSGLEADLPLVGRFPRVPQPDSGLAPDIFVPQTQRSIAANQDVAMIQAMAAVSA